MKQEYIYKLMNLFFYTIHFSDSIGENIKSVGKSTDEIKKENRLSFLLAPSPSTTFSESAHKYGTLLQSFFIALIQNLMT